MKHPIIDSITMKVVSLDEMKSIYNDCLILLQSVIDKNDIDVDLFSKRRAEKSVLFRYAIWVYFTNRFSMASTNWKPVFGYDRTTVIYGLSVGRSDTLCQNIYNDIVYPILNGVLFLANTENVRPQAKSIAINSNIKCLKKKK